MPHTHDSWPAAWARHVALTHAALTRLIDDNSRSFDAYARALYANQKELASVADGAPRFKRERLEALLREHIDGAVALTKAVARRLPTKNAMDSWRENGRHLAALVADLSGMPRDGGGDRVFDDAIGPHLDVTFAYIESYARGSYDAAAVVYGAALTQAVVTLGGAWTSLGRYRTSTASAAAAALVYVPEQSRAATIMARARRK